jgi:hypothetical protein
MRQHLPPSNFALFVETGTTTIQLFNRKILQYRIQEKMKTMMKIHMAKTNIPNLWNRLDVLSYLEQLYNIQNEHCYQVNDCSGNILVIKGGTYFLRHCQPFSNKIFIL